MYRNLFPNYLIEDEYYTIFDVYLIYLEERRDGHDELACDFGTYLDFLDGYGITEDGEYIYLWTNC